MEYVKITNGQPERYSLARFKDDYPDTSIAIPATPEVLAPFDIYPLIDEPPEYDTNTEEFARAGISYVDDAWRQQYVVRPVPNEILRGNALARYDVIRDERRAKEAAGVQFTTGGGKTYTIFTDKESRFELAELIIASQEGLLTDTDEIRVGDEDGDPIYVPVTVNVLKIIYAQTIAYLKKCSLAEAACVTKMKAAYAIKDTDAFFAVDYETEFNNLP